MTDQNEELAKIEKALAKLEELLILTDSLIKDLKELEEKKENA